MRQKLSRALLLCLVALILSALLLASAPPTALAVNTYQSKILDTFGDDIIAYWPLTETEGSTAYDVSGNSYNGTYNGVTLDAVDAPGATMGRVGRWDGINDYVALYSSGLANALVTPHAGTVALWVKRNSDRHPILYLGNNTSTSAVYFRYFSPGYRAYRNTTGAFLGTDILSADADWHVVVFVWDSDAGTMRLYVDGTKTSDANSGAAGGITIGTWAAIGRWDGAALNYWDGWVSNVIVFDRAFTDDDVAIVSDPDPINNPTPTPTPTPLPLSHYLTLESGQPVRLDYSATAGDMLIGTLLLVFVGLLAFLAFLGLVKR